LKAYLSLTRIIAIFSLIILGTACKDEGTKKGDSSGSFPTPKKIESTSADGLARLTGQEEPYTGPVILRDEAGKMRYYAYYQDGKLHGAEIKYYDDGKIRRQFDYHLGEKIHHREWFPNGNRKIDAEMRDGIGYGSHRTWFEDGRTRWSGRFVEDLLWQGHIVDYAEDGRLMWDAVFEKGRYLSGVYPEAEQENLLKAGLLKPENAKFPIKPPAPAPAPAP
jgi:antitoxin component YwqK of YwqJK toxin-antitoxin module